MSFLDTLTLAEPDDGDYFDVYPLLRRAFGGGSEARLVVELREAGAIVVDMAARIDQKIVGYVLLSRLWIDPPSGGARAAIPGLALAPAAVAPGLQRLGIGSALIRAALAVAAWKGERFVLVLGDPDYYSRFGFSPAAAETLISDYSSPAFQALALAPSALDGLAGRVRYAEPFSRLDAE